MSVYLVLDRIEEGIAVLFPEGQREPEINLPAAYLPEGTREGHILRLILEIDEERTSFVRTRVSALLRRLQGERQP